MTGFQLRQGEEKDLPQVLELIRELAEFENAPNEVENTVELMKKDGFGPDSIFSFFVVVDEKGFIPGVAIFYYRYSTWKGRRLYLEDLVVTKSHRGQGLGKMLFERVMVEAHEKDCTGMVWQVLDWNEPAMVFYKKYQSAFDSEWVNCSVEREQLRQVASSFKY